MLDMILNRVTRRTASCITLGLSTIVLLSGCGGATSSTQSFGKFTANGPVAFGLQALDAVQTSPTSAFYVETSGAATPDFNQTFATAAVASTALPVANETSSVTKTIPLGFGPGARYVDNVTFGKALHPSDPFIFGASIANGLDGSGNFIGISGVSLASTDLGIASQVMTFSPRFTGGLANAQYKTSTVTVPADATTGLKQLTVTVSDTAPSATRNSPSTTTYDLVVLAGNDSAVLAQINDANGPVVGATATIDGANAPGYVGFGQTAGTTNGSVSDTQGMILLFAPAGDHTVTVSSGTENGTLALTMFPGYLTDTTADGKVSSPTSDNDNKAQKASLTITIATPTPATK